MREFYMDKRKCADAWKIANESLKNYFGNLFPMRKPSPAPLSYGHLICLGAAVTIPDDGEPNVSSFANSIEEAIDILKEKRKMDFSQNELFVHYLDVWEHLKKCFPEGNLPFTGFGDEGPITSAVLMRGQDFFCDIYDEPEKCRAFLLLLTDSIIDFKKLCRRINNEPEIQDNASIADDFASLISPSMWDDFVVPYWDTIYESLCSGKERFLHVENLVPEHLKYLEKARVTHYQPSVSEKITLESIRENLHPGINYDWLLYSYHITGMTNKQIEDWIDRAVHNGVSIIRTQLGAYTHMLDKFDRITAFFDVFNKYIA